MTKKGCYTEKYSAKFAKACICSQTKTIFAGKLFRNKEIPCHFSTLWKQSLADYANAVTVHTLPRKPLSLTFYGLYVSHDNVFSIECIPETAREQNKCWSCSNMKTDGTIFFNIKHAWTSHLLWHKKLTSKHNNKPLSNQVKRERETGVDTFIMN